jgi:hypothetical protein
MPAAVAIVPTSDQPQAPSSSPRREQRGAVRCREEDLLWDELVAYDLLAVVAADRGEDADRDHPGRGHARDRGQA